MDFDAFIVLHQNGGADLPLVNIVDGHLAGLEDAILFTPEDNVVSINGKTIPASLLRTAGRLSYGARRCFGRFHGCNRGHEHRQRCRELRAYVRVGVSRPVGRLQRQLDGRRCDD